MKKSQYKLPLALSALALATFVTLVPATVIADDSSANPYMQMAAVGADGHDHEHAPEPVVASDGHTDHEHAPGASSILVPGSGPWWGVMFVSLVLMALLSFGVWKYLQVAPVKSADEKKDEKPVS